VPSTRQSDVRPTVPASGAQALDFVPSGWTLEHDKQGDLNKDGQPDLLLVLRKNYKLDAAKPDDFDPLNRMLLVAFGDKAAQGYRLVLLNTALIPPRETANLDDILDWKDTISVDGHSYKISMHVFMSAGGWDTGTTRFHFRYQDGGFALIGYDHDNTHRGSGKTTQTSINYLTHKAKITTGSIEHDRKKIIWKKLPKAELIRLDDIEDGLSFDPGLN
jgi:hypothetical protein